MGGGGGSGRGRGVGGGGEVGGGGSGRGEEGRWEGGGERREGVQNVQVAFCTGGHIYSNIIIGLSSPTSNFNKKNDKLYMCDQDIQILGTDLISPSLQLWQ